MNRLLLDLPREQYENLAGENWSLLKKIGQSPAHYAHAKAHPDAEDRDTLVLGAAAHVSTLEPDLYGGSIYDAADFAQVKPNRGRYAVWPAKNGKRGTNAWDAAEATCARHGVTLLREVDHLWCVRIATAVNLCPAAKKYLAGPREVTMQWEHVEPAVGGLEGFKFQMKGRPDKVATDGKPFALVDLKTTIHSDPVGFAKEAARLEYAAQAALYSDGYAAITGVRLPFVWIAVEKTPPHNVVVYRLRPVEYELGRNRYRDLLQRLDACNRSGKFGGYAEGEMELEFPTWALPDEHESEAA